MNDSIINGIFTLSGVLMGGIVSYFITKSSRDYKRLKSNTNEMSHQIMSYWNLEKLYSKEIAKLNSKSEKTVLQEYRDKIEEMNLTRPTMTEKNARKILGQIL